MDVAKLSLSIDTRDAEKATRTVRTFTSATQKAGQIVSSAVSAMAANWKAVAIGTAAASVAMRGLSGTVAVLREFEGSIAAVGAISRAGADDLAAMRDIAKDLGSTTEFTASQAADGMRFLAMAGFDAAESMAAIPDVLDLATASGMDLANAADITSNIMSAFGVEAANAAEVTDALAAVSSRANTSVEQLGEGMKYVGPVAAALGIGINDTASAMGVLSDNGLQGAMAGTGLRKVLSSLINPTKEAKDALNAMGVSLDQVNPQTTSLTDIVDTLAEAGIGAAEALTIFGDRGGPAILALSSSRGRLRELTGEMQNVKGAATEMAGIMRDNLDGDIQSLGSAVQGLAIALGEAGLTNILRLVVQGLTGTVRAITKLVDYLGSLPAGVVNFLGIQDGIATATDNVTLAMGDEISQANALFTLMGSGSTMTQSAALATLSQAEAHMRAAAALREQKDAAAALQMVELTIDYQDRLDGLKAIREGSDAYKEQEIALVDILGRMNEIRTVQQSAVGDFEAAQAEVVRIRDAISNAVDGMVTFSGEIITARDLTERLHMASTQVSFSGAAAEAQELSEWLGISLSRALALASTTPMMSDEDAAMSMSVIPDAAQRETNRGAVLNFNSLTEEKTSRGSAGGGRGGESDAQKARNALMEEGKRLTLELRTEQEVYNAALARNNELLQAGAIDQGTFQAANAQLNEQMAHAKFDETISNIETLSAGLMNAAMNGDNLGEALIQMLGQMAVKWLAAAIAAKAADVLSGGILSASMGAGPGGGVGGGGGVLSLIGLANGTNNARGGMTLVGERGPEVVNLPKGSQVVPNDRIGSHLKQSAPMVNVESNPEIIVLNDPRKIDEYRTSPKGEQARARANRRMNNA